MEPSGQINAPSALARIPQLHSEQEAAWTPEPSWTEQDKKMIFFSCRNSNPEPSSP